MLSPILHGLNLFLKGITLFFNAAWGEKCESGCEKKWGWEIRNGLNSLSWLPYHHPQKMHIRIRLKFNLQNCVLIQQPIPNALPVSAFPQSHLIELMKKAGNGGFYLCQYQWHCIGAGMLRVRHFWELEHEKRRGVINVLSGKQLWVV